MSTITPLRSGTTFGPETLTRAIRGPVLLASDATGATDAAPIAARLAAERLGASIDVIAVVEPLPLYTNDFGAPLLPAELVEGRRAELHAAVVRRLEPVLGPRDGWRVEVRYGPPGRTIADVARERRAGLIVLGTGGHRVVDRVLGEEISLQVVRHADTPVLAVAPDAARPMRRAVVAVDFSASSIRAAQAALALLEPGPEGTGLLTLVHVRSPLENTPPMLATWSSEYDASIGAMFVRLRELLRPVVPDHVTVETRTVTGAVVESLREVATRTDASLVAVGTHGPGWVERLFVGSVATSTLRRVGTSVLVTPPPSPAERVRLELWIAGQVTLDERADWAGALEVLTRRNLDRRARLEVSDPALDGFAVEADGYRFLGAAYDERDARVSIMLGDLADRARHVTHEITHVRSVEIVAADDHCDRALLVEDARGDTVLTFMD